MKVDDSCDCKKECGLKCLVLLIQGVPKTEMAFYRAPCMKVKQIKLTAFRTGHF